MQREKKKTHLICSCLTESIEDESSNQSQWSSPWLAILAFANTLRNSSTTLNSQSNHSLLPLLIFSYLQALIHGFLRWWASSWLIFFLKWRLQSFLFHLHSYSTAMIFKKQRTPLMKKIQGLQAPMELTSLSMIAMVTKLSVQAE